MIDVAVLVGSQVREATTGRTGRISSVSLPWVRVAWNQDLLYRAIDEVYARSDPKIWTDFELFTLNGGWVSMGSLLGSRPRGRVAQFTEDIERLLTDSDELEERVEIPNEQEQKEAWKLLKDALKRNQLPTKAGMPRKATADEFMLMHKSEPYYGFKHRTTRNYVFVDRYTKLLTIPSKPDAFMRGEFDLELEAVQTEVMFRETRSLPFRRHVFETQAEASEFVCQLLNSEYEEVRWHTSEMEEDWEVELTGLFQALVEGCRACEQNKLESLTGTNLFERKRGARESKAEDWDCTEEGECLYVPSGFAIKIDFGE